MGSKSTRAQPGVAAWSPADEQWLKWLGDQLGPEPPTKGTRRTNVMENEKFIQIATATASQSVMIYALDDHGNVWKCVEGGQPRVSEPKWILMKYERQR